MKTQPKNWSSVVVGVAVAGLGTYVLARLARRNGRARAKGEDNVSVPYRHGARVEKSVTVNQSPQALYDMFRRRENLPPFLQQLLEDAEIIHDEQNTMLGWRSRD